MLARKEVPSGVAAWQRVKEKLQEQTGPSFELWFPSIQFVSYNDGFVHLSVATDFQRKGIEKSYLGTLLELWQQEEASATRVVVTHRNGLHKVPAVWAPPPPAPHAPERPAPAPPRPAPFSSVPLESQFTLERFLVGKPNQLAFAYAQQVVEWSSQESAACQPIYFHGGPGLGKTHLLQGIARACTQGAARYLGSYALANQIAGFQSGLQLRNWIGETRVFLFDNLDAYWSGKPPIREFSYLLQALIDSGRPVVMAGACPPETLEQFDKKTRSLIERSLVLEFLGWDAIFRLEFLRDQVRRNPGGFPTGYLSEEVLAYIAGIEGQEGRSLLKALRVLSAHAAARPGSLTLEGAQKLLEGILITPLPKKVRVEDVFRVVCRHYGISRADLLSSRRTANIVRPRQIAMYLAKTLTLQSLPEIGRRVGGRDHTTVLHAVRKIEGLLQGDRVLQEEIEALKRTIAQSAMG